MRAMPSFCEKRANIGLPSADFLPFKSSMLFTSKLHIMK
jgi:hypothetical protein